MVDLLICTCKHPMKPDHVRQQVQSTADGKLAPLGAAGIFECTSCGCQRFCSAGVVPIIRDKNIRPSTMAYGGPRALAREARMVAARAAATAKGQNITANQEELVQHGILRPLLYSGDNYSCPECHETTEPVKDIKGFEVCTHCGLLGAKDTPDGKRLLGLTYHAAKKPGRAEFTRIKWHSEKDRCDQCPALPKVVVAAAAKKKEAK